MFILGFFVLSPKVIDYIDTLETHWEYAPLHRLVEERQIDAYFHRGFWQCMDTLRDRNHLEEYWSQETPPWKVWD